MLLLLPLGLFLPGYFTARLFRLKLWAASAFVLSLPILFHCIFWLGAIGVPIKVWSVAPLLIAATGTLAWAQRKFSPPHQKESAKAPWTGDERILFAASAVVGLILLVHSARTPLVGQDTRFRWDFLAQLIAQFGNFNFYPPLHPADFRSYFFVEGIPPLVSFTHWWLYASGRGVFAGLICLRVAAEFIGTLAFTYGTASALFSRRAGVLAAAALAGSPLYFRSVFLGQETGLTALGVAAMLYFIVSARQPVPAGLAAGLCALSREYGWIALVAGVIALAWRREGRKAILVFGAVAAAAAAPWYVRNAILAGNPLYSLRFAAFAVNPIHDAILQFYKSRFGVQTWTASNWVSVFLLLLSLAVPQVLAGIPGAFREFRKHGYLPVIALLVTGVWIVSVGYTIGGVEISMRVAQPGAGGAVDCGGWRIGAVEEPEEDSGADRHRRVSVLDCGAGYVVCAGSSLSQSGTMGGERISGDRAADGVQASRRVGEDSAARIAGAIRQRLTCTRRCTIPGSKWCRSGVPKCASSSPRRLVKLSGDWPSFTSPASLRIREPQMPPTSPPRPRCMRRSLNDGACWRNLLRLCTFWCRKINSVTRTAASSSDRRWLRGGRGCTLRGARLPPVRSTRLSASCRRLSSVTRTAASSSGSRLPRGGM